MDFLPPLLMQFSAISLTFCGWENKVGYDIYMYPSHFRYTPEKKRMSLWVLWKRLYKLMKRYLFGFLFPCFFCKSHLPRLGCIFGWLWIFYCHLWCWFTKMKIVSGLKPSFCNKYMYLNRTLFSFPQPGNFP